MKTNYQNMSMLDMVFEHRNKAYGAYVLRRDYDKSLIKAITITIASVLFVMLGNFIAGKLSARNAGIVERNTIITCKALDPIKKDIKVEQKQENKARNKPTIENREKRVVADAVDMDTVPDKKDLAMFDPGLSTNLNVPASLGVEGGQGTEDVFQVAAPTPPPGGPLRFADTMPEFPGGEAALMRYLKRYIQFPEIDRDAGISGRVVSEFTVNEDGSIADVVIIKGLSKGCDREVKRVVQMLPKFKPGIQAGRAVKVKFVLPVTFVNNDY